MKRTVLITLILPKSELTSRQQLAMPEHWRYGRKRLRITVEAGNELDAIEIARATAENAGTRSSDS